ncbi:MAG: TIGR00156 family protein [Nitrospirales bacterium]|nr:MAG: TIGR00156 family protein [Nitrospirales bacterium]
MSTRIMLMVLGLIVSSALAVSAQFQGAGRAEVRTVSAAQEAVDDSWVSLTGTILRQVSAERYLFQDATGTMVVEIDHDKWRNVSVNPETIVCLSGEIDKDWSTTEMEVETVDVVTASSQGPRQTQ